MRRPATLSLLLIATLVILYSATRFVSPSNGFIPSSLTSISTSTASLTSNSRQPPEAQLYFSQVFSPSPAAYSFPVLREYCAHAPVIENAPYLQCGAMSAGLTSIMSQLRGCFLMAIQSGTNLVLPSMPLRDSTDLRNFNFMNGSAYRGYEEWFDADHLVRNLKAACPRLKTLYIDQLTGHDYGEKGDTKVARKWDVDVGTAPEFQLFKPYFWVGRPFRNFFHERYEKLLQGATAEEKKAEGITVVTIAAFFMMFRILDDPTMREQKLWNELGLLLRFRETERSVVQQLLSKMDRPFYGVHFRVEKDTIWSSLDHQLEVDLNALDQAWEKFKPSPQATQKPLVYLACGDEGQIEKFAAAAKERDWEVVHKWSLARDDAKMLQDINSLPFDFQGGVDLGIMVRAGFFMGIMGSAFSSSIGNARDSIGRYRGNSLLLEDDGGARTILFNDGDAEFYACCL